MISHVVFILNHSFISLLLLLLLLLFCCFRVNPAAVLAGFAASYTTSRKTRCNEYVICIDYFSELLSMKRVINSLPSARVSWSCGFTVLWWRYSGLMITTFLLPAPSSTPSMITSIFFLLLQLIILSPLLHSFLFQSFHYVDTQTQHQTLLNPQHWSTRHFNTN